MGLVVVSLFDGISCGRLALERAGFVIDKYYACIKELLREQSELYFDALEENEKLLAMNRKKPLEWLKKINPYIRKILEKFKGG